MGGLLYGRGLSEKRYYLYPWDMTIIKYSFNDREYQLYEIGLGTDRHYLCLYQDGQTVAIVHKPTEVKSHIGYLYGVSGECAVPG